VTFLVFKTSDKYETDRNVSKVAEEKQFFFENFGEKLAKACFGR